MMSYPWIGHGGPATELGELLGVEFSIVEPPDVTLCFAVQVARDPYSPKFLFVGATDGGNSFVGLGSDDFAC